MAKYKEKVNMHAYCILAGVEVKEVSEDDFNDSEGNLLTAIDSDQLPFAGSPPRMSLEIPQELLQDLQENDCPDLRLVSALYYNVSGLFPGSLQGRNE